MANNRSFFKTFWYMYFWLACLLIVLTVFILEVGFGIDVNLGPKDTEERSGSLESNETKE